MTQAEVKLLVPTYMNVLWADLKLRLLKKPAQVQGAVLCQYFIVCARI